MFHTRKSMNRMKYIYVILTALLFCSCKSHDFKKFICNDGVKYWEDIDVNGKIDGCYSFSKEGKCLAYFYNKSENCKRILLSNDDVIIDSTWKLNDDSILYYRSINAKILIINEDTLITEYKGKKHLFLKSRCQKPSPQTCEEIK